MYTRKQYLNKECSFNEYYEQFGQHLTHDVEAFIGKDKIINSTDSSFNDIPLKEWDQLAPIVRITVGRAIAEANGTGGISLSDCVCSAKAAARLIKERNS